MLRLALEHFTSTHFGENRVNLPFDNCSSCFALHELAVNATFQQRPDAQQVVSALEMEHPQFTALFNKYRDHWNKQKDLLQKKTALEAAIKFADDYYAGQLATFQNV